MKLRPGLIAVLVVGLGGCGGGSGKGGTGGSGGGGTGGGGSGGAGGVQPPPPPTGGSGGAAGSGGGGGRGGSGGASGAGGAGGGPGGSGGATDAAAHDGPGARLDGGPPADGANQGGGNSIAGMVMGKPFNAVATALWGGRPDFPNTNTLIFLFEKPIACAAIGAPGWDVPAAQAGNQVLEIKMGIPTAGGTTPMTFTVRPPTPMGMASPGQAEVTHTFLGPGAMDLGAASGTITLTSKTANKNATGTFDIVLNAGAGTLKGSFDATWGPTGQEP
jgi:hypothetical protein